MRRTLFFMLSICGVFAETSHALELAKTIENIRKHPEKITYDEKWDLIYFYSHKSSIILPLIEELIKDNHDTKSVNKIIKEISFARELHRYDHDLQKRTVEFLLQNNSKLNAQLQVHVRRNLLRFYLSTTSDNKGLINPENIIVLDDYYHDDSELPIDKNDLKNAGKKLTLLADIFKNRKKQLKWNNPFMILYKEFNDYEVTAEDDWALIIDLKHKRIGLVNNKHGAEIIFIGKSQWIDENTLAPYQLRIRDRENALERELVGNLAVIMEHELVPEIPIKFRESLLRFFKNLKPEHLDDSDDVLYTRERQGEYKEGESKQLYKEKLVHERYWPQIFTLHNPNDRLLLERVCESYIKKWQIVAQRELSNIATHQEIPSNPREIFENSVQQEKGNIKEKLKTIFDPFYSNIHDEMSQQDSLFIDQIKQEFHQDAKFNGLIEYIENTLNEGNHITQISDIFIALAGSFYDAGDFEKSLKWALISRDWYVKTNQEYLGSGYHIGPAESYCLLLKIYESDNEKKLPLTHLETSLRYLLEEQDSISSYYPEKRRVSEYFYEHVAQIANSRNNYTLADRALHEYLSRSSAICNGNIYLLINSYAEAKRLDTFKEIATQTKHAHEVLKYLEEFLSEQSLQPRNMLTIDCYLPVKR